MGSWTRNFLVPKGDPNTLRNNVVGWLERKGFDLAQHMPPFTDTTDDERAVCLVSNAHWTVILYREAFEEGDRLLSELDDLLVVLEVMIADSDIWGYDLIEKGELTASFNSNPRYFGGNDQKLPLNGDPERLCRSLGMTGREKEVGRVQRRWSLFSDFPCRSFCRLIGASAGALHFNDFNVRATRIPAARELAGWRVEPLYFERRRQFGEGPPELVLHSLAVRQFETQERRETIDPALPKELNSITRMIGLLFTPLKWVFWTLGPFIRWWVRREQKKHTEGRTGDSLLDALCLEVGGVEKQEGPWLVNRFYSCRIRAPRATTTNPMELMMASSVVFRFSVNQVLVSATVIRPEQLSKFFLLQKDKSLVADDLFFAQSHAARHLALKIEAKKRTGTIHYWFLELRDLTMLFQTSTEQSLTLETVEAIKTVIQTFEQVPTQ